MSRGDFMSRKAQGISINVIIISAIALLVLVILATLLFQSGVIFRDKLKACGVDADAPGTCRPASPGCSEGEQQMGLNYDCPKAPDGSDQVCCNPFTG